MLDELLLRQPSEVGRRQVPVFSRDTGLPVPDPRDPNRQAAREEVDYESVPVERLNKTVFQDEAYTMYDTANTDDFGAAGNLDESVVKARLEKAKRDFGWESTIDEKFANTITSATGRGGTQDIPPKILARFLSIVQRAEITVQLFSNDNETMNILNAVYKAAHHGNKEANFQPEDVLKFIKDKGMKEYIEELRKLIKEVTPYIQPGGTNAPGVGAGTPGPKLDLRRVQDFTRKLQAIPLPEEFVKKQEDPRYAAGANTDGQDRNLDTFVKVTELANKWMIDHLYKGNSNPVNMTEIMGIIMLTESKYRTGKRRQLIDADGKIQMHNFLKWWYDKMYYFSDFQDDDEFSPYSYIAFYSQFRQVSAAELIITEPSKFFNDIQISDIAWEKPNPYGGGKDIEPITEANFDEAKMRFRNTLVSVLTGESVNHNNAIRYEKIRGKKGDEWLQGMAAILDDKLGFNSRWCRLYGQLATGGNGEELAEFLSSSRGQTEMAGTVGKARSMATMLNYHLDQFGGNPFLIDGSLNESNAFLKALIGNNQGGEMRGARKFFQSMIFQMIMSNSALSTIGNLAKGENASTGRFTRIQMMYEFMVDQLKDERCFGRDDPEFEEAYAKDNLLELLGNGRLEGSMRGDFLKKFKGKFSEAELDAVWTSIQDTSFIDILIRPFDALEKTYTTNDAGVRSDVALFRNIRQFVANASLESEIKMAQQMLPMFKDKNWKDFSYLNYFNDKRRKDRNVLGFMKKAIQDSVQAAFNIPQEDARYICHFVWLQQAWTGVEAKNDTSVDSSSYWTTIMQTFGYRKGKEKGVFTGDPEFYNGLIRGLTVLDGMRVGIHGYIDEDEDKHYPTVSPQDVSFLEYVQGGNGLDFGNYGVYNQMNGKLHEYAMAQFRDWHLTNLSKLRDLFYDPQKNLDFTDIMKREHGTGRLVVDNEKLQKFSNFRNVLRNYFSKNDWAWGLSRGAGANGQLEIEYEVDPRTGREILHPLTRQKIPVIDKVTGRPKLKIKKGGLKMIVRDWADEGGKKFQWREVSMEEAIFSRDILDLVPEMNQQDVVLTETLPEQIVRSVVGWTLMMGFEKHNEFYGHPLRAIKELLSGRKLSKSSLWGSYTPDEFEYAQEFFTNFNLFSEADEDTKGKTWMGLGNKGHKMKIYKTKNGYFSGKEFKAIRRMVGITRLQLAEKEVTTGLLGALFAFFLEYFLAGFGTIAPKGK